MARRRKRRRKYSASRRKRRGYIPMNPNPRRRRRHYRANPRRRHYRARRRSYYHNPPPRIQSIAGELGWAAAGFMTTKVVGNMVTPMLAGAMGAQPVIRIALKFGVAYLSAWGLSNFMGARVFMPAMLGGSLEAIQDTIKTFIAPTFPMLAANYEPLEIYYEPSIARLPARRGGMSAYYDMGDGLSPDHDAVV